MSLLTDKTPAQADALRAFMSTHDMSVRDVLAALVCEEHRAAILAEALGDTDHAKACMGQGLAIQLAAEPRFIAKVSAARL